MSLNITKSGILSINESNVVNSNLITVDKSFEKTGWVINLFTKTWMNENLIVGKTYTLHYFVTCTNIPTVANIKNTEARPMPILVHQNSGWNQYTTCSGTQTTNMALGETKEYTTVFTFARATESYEHYGLCMYTFLIRDQNDATYYSTFRIDNLKLEEGSVVTPWVSDIGNPSFQENIASLPASFGKNFISSNNFYEY